MSVYTCVGESADARGWGLIPLEMELQTFVDYLTWLLGSQSFERLRQEDTLEFQVSLAFPDHT